MLLILLLTMPCMVAIAQETPEQMISRFFDLYENEGVSPAIDDLYSSNRWVDAGNEAVVELKSQLAGLDTNLVGEYYGYELLSSHNLTDSFVLYIYMVKFERQPIRFIFQYYKPLDTWMTYSFEFDGNLNDDFKRLAKESILKK